MSCCCCCDCDNNIEDYDIDQLVDEINYRAQKGKGSLVRMVYADDLPDIFRALRRGDVVEATALLEQSLMPKWRDVEACKKQYKEAQLDMRAW